MPPIKSLKSTNRNFAKIGIKSSQAKIKKLDDSSLTKIQEAVKQKISTEQINTQNSTTTLAKDLGLIKDISDPTIPFNKIPDINKIRDQEKSGKGGGFFTTEPAINTVEIAKSFSKGNDEIIGSIGGIQVENSIPKEAPKNKSNDPIYVDIRPDVLMLTSFNPIFYDDLTNTEQGNLFDVFVESLRQMDASSISLLKNVDQNFIQEQNKKAKIELEKTKKQLDTLYENLKLISKIEKSLSIVNPIHDFTISSFINKFFPSFLLNDLSQSRLIEYIKLCPEKLNLITSLSNALKISEDKLRKYPSVVIWAMFVQELKELIRSHSIDFLINKNSSPDNASDMLFDQTDTSTNVYSLVNYRYNDRLSVEKLKKLEADFSNLVDFSPNVDKHKNFQKLDEQFFNHILGDQKKISLAFYLILKEIYHSNLLQNLSLDKDVANRNLVLNNIFGLTHSDPGIINNSITKPNILQQVNSTVIDAGYFFDQTFQKNILTFGTSADKESIIDDSTIGQEYFFSPNDIENIRDILNFDKFKSYSDFLKSQGKSLSNLMEAGIVPEIVSNKNLNFDPYAVLIGRILDLIDEDSGELLRLKTNKQGFLVEASQSISNKNGSEKDIVAFLSFAGNQNGTIGKYKNAQEGQPLASYKMRMVLYSCAMSMAKIISGNSEKFTFENLTDVVVTQFDELSVSIHEIFVEMFQKDKSIVNKEISFINDYGKLYSTVVTTTGEVLLLTADGVKSGKVRNNLNFVLHNSSTSKNGYLYIIASALAVLIQNGLEFLCPVYFSSICKLINASSRLYIENISFISDAIDLGGKGGPTKLQLNYLLDKTYQKPNAAISLRTSIVSNIREEITKLISMFSSAVNFFNNVNQNILKLASFNFNEQFSYFLQYLNGDPKKVALLFKEPQIAIAHSYVEDLIQSYNSFEKNESNESFLLNVQGLSHSKKLVSLIKKAFSTSEYTYSKGYNKKIISVGFPQGLIKNLLEKYIDQEKSIDTFKIKQNDICKIAIYKIDIMNDTIVYKPKEFLFEISRFPIKVNDSIIENFNFGLASSLKTRNYSLYTDGYFSEALGNVSEAFGNNYQFLSNDEKQEILNNHAISFILENYLHVISGLKVEDSTFTLASSQEIETNYKRLIDDKTQDIIEEISKNNIDKIFQYVGKSIEPAFNIASVSIPNSEAIISRIIHPKKYDRVFNIIFDPEFVVDYEASDKSRIQYLLSNDGGNRLKRVKINNKNEYVDSDKSIRDASFDSYFVSVQLNPAIFDFNFANTTQSTDMNADLNFANITKGSTSNTASNYLTNATSTNTSKYVKGKI